jgi:ADP-ribose pyrophosphatase YjhB (NUDIX family)
MITCTFENGNQNSLRHVTVGCLVIKDGKILLGKRSEGLLEAGKWCLLGGYVNRDETTAEAGIREAREESGWLIENLQILRINDNPVRPHEDRQNVDFIYIADAIEKVGEKDWESEEVVWYPLDALPADDQIAFDHLDSINLYKRYLEAPFSLPVVGPIRTA